MIFSRQQAGFCSRFLLFTLCRLHACFPLLSRVFLRSSSPALDAARRRIPRVNQTRSIYDSRDGRIRCTSHFPADQSLLSFSLSLLVLLSSLLFSSLFFSLFLFGSPKALLEGTASLRAASLKLLWVTRHRFSLLKLASTSARKWQIIARELMDFGKFSSMTIRVEKYQTAGVDPSEKIGIKLEFRS